MKFKIIIFLLVFNVMMLNAFDKIKINGSFTDETNYENFIKEISAAVRFDQTYPAVGMGLLGFDIKTNFKMLNISNNDSYWKIASGDNVSSAPANYFFAPQIIVSKGLFSDIDLEVMYMPVLGADISAMGAALKFPLMEGSMIKPAISLRTAYTTLTQKTNFKLDDISTSLSISKGLGVKPITITPYAMVSYNYSKLKPQDNALNLSSKSTSSFSYGAGIKADVGFIGFHFNVIKSRIITYNTAFSIGF